MPGSQEVVGPIQADWAVSGQKEAQVLTQTFFMLNLAESSLMKVLFGKSLWWWLLLLLFLLLLLLWRRRRWWCWLLKELGGFRSKHLWFFVPRFLLPDQVGVAVDGNVRFRCLRLLLNNF